MKFNKSLLEFSKFNTVTVLSKLVAVFFLPYLTTILVKDEIGTIAVYTRLIGFMSIIFGLGYFSQIIKIKKKSSLKKLINEFIIILSFGFIFSIIFFLFPNFFNYNLGLIFLAGVTLSGLTFFRNYYRLNSLTDKYLFNEIVFIITSVALSLIFLFFYKNHISRVWGLCLGYIITLIFYISRFTEISFDFKISLTFFKNSILLIPHIILKWVRSRSDLVLIAVFFSSSIISDYAIALSVASLSLVFYDAHNQFFLSISKNNLQKNNLKNWLKNIFFSVVFYFVIMIGLQLFIDLIYSIFNWDDYLQGKIYARILCVIFFFRAIPNLITVYFNYNNLNIILSKITFSISIFYIIFGTLLLKYFNIEYFLYMLIFLEICILGIYYYFIKNGKSFN